jgi:hypothetical protein
MFKNLRSPKRKPKDKYGWFGDYASYPAWFFHKEFFLSHFSDRYKVVAEFPSYVEGEAVMFIDDRPQGANKGFYLMNSSKYA